LSYELQYVGQAKPTSLTLKMKMAKFLALSSWKWMSNLAHEAGKNIVTLN
jgi:hypothetical protein